MISMMLSRNAKNVGFWSDNNIPIENSNTISTKDLNKAIFVIEKEMLNAADKGHLNYCKGSSRCRICNILNGSIEYCITINNKKFIMPEGYLHYIKDHNVQIDSELLKAIFE